MQRVVIGIVGTPAVDDENYNVVALYDEYKNMAVEKDCIPFMIPAIQNVDFEHTRISEIPPLTEKEMDMYMEMIDKCDGIIIPGGYRMYKYNDFIVKYALEKDMPIFGICLGMQILAGIDNGEYCVEKLPNENHKKRGIDYAHRVIINEDSLLNKIVGSKEINVNSRHMYHVTHLNKFVPTAYSDDGLIEAIELPERSFVMGVQWHPEKMIKYDLNANKIIDAFVAECKKKKLEKEEYSKII